MRSSGVPHCRQITAWQSPHTRGSATGFAHALLFLSYWTWVLPFGLLARRFRPRAGWREPLAARTDERALHSQY